MSQRFPEAARRVSRRQIERFYQTCGDGTFDAVAIDDVGVALYARCRSMLGDLICPDCSQPVTRQARTLVCSDCEWSCPWDVFRRCPAGKHLWAGRMEPYVARFVCDYGHAKTASQKVVLIDTLIHRFHGEMEGGSKPGAYNLIEGEIADVARFLDQITYGDHMPEEVAVRKQAWRKRVRSGPAFWSNQVDGDGG